MSGSAGGGGNSTGCETPSLISVAYSELPFLSRAFADSKSFVDGLFGGPFGSFELRLPKLLFLLRMGCLQMKKHNFTKTTKVVPRYRQLNYKTAFHEHPKAYLSDPLSLCNKQSKHIYWSHRWCEGNVFSHVCDFVHGRWSPSHDALG